MLCSLFLVLPASADTTPPTVVSTNPADGAVKVHVDIDQITIEFNEPIQYVPAGWTKVSLKSYDGGLYTDYAIGAISVSGSTLIISAPNTPWFALWEDYFVRVEGVQDLDGNDMAPGYYDLHFKTIATDTTPATVVSTYPANGATNVPLDVTITATMNELIDKCVGMVTMVDRNNNFVELLSSHNIGYESPDNINLVIKPKVPLVKGETYTVTIREMKDSYYNVMETPYSWTFSTTGMPPITEIAAKDSYSSLPRCGWFNTTVQVSLSATDYSGSGISKTEYSLDGGGWITYGGTFTIEKEGITYVAYHSIDNDGNIESPQSLNVKIDKTPPTITGVVIDPVTQIPLPPNANGWYSSDVTVRFTARDELSGILYDGGPGQDHITDIKLCTEGTNRVATMTVQDMPGSPATVTLYVNIDKTPPSITINIPVNSAHYILNENIHADWSASDSLSGITTQSGTVPTGSAIDTAKVGTKQFGVTAIDKAGIKNTKTISYTVDSQADATKNVIIYVDNSNLPQGAKKALKAELNAAVTSLNKGNPKIAKTILQAIIIEVKALRGKMIPTNQADSLIAQMQRIIKTL